MPGPENVVDCHGSCPGRDDLTRCGEILERHNIARGTNLVCCLEAAPDQQQQVFCNHKNIITEHGDWKPVAEITQEKYQRPEWCPLIF